MIPENKQPAVKKALKATFGTDAFESIQQLTKGLSSALIFKIVVYGKPYLLRVITRTDDMADPTYYFERMKIGAEAALAPRIHYLSVEDRISITDFIEAQPFAIDDARAMMPRLLHQLHSLPKFPFRIHYLDAMERFMDKFRSDNIVPEDAIKDLFDQYTRIAGIYPRNDREDWVSCHNDLKPENILFDGQRPWLVDWEGAFLNDRYLDLAVVANFVVRDEQEENDYLGHYFEEAVNEYKHARFFLMCQLLHMFYFTFFMLTGSEGKPVDINNVGKWDFRAFHDGIWNGRISLVGSDTRLQYALVHATQFRYNTQTNRFEDAMRIVAAEKK